MHLHSSSKTGGSSAESFSLTDPFFEPLKAQLACAEQERDEARQSASEGVRQVQDLEEKLIEVSSLLTGWNNGKNGGAARNQPTSPLAMVGRPRGRLGEE